MVKGLADVKEKAARLPRPLRNETWKMEQRLTFSMSLMRKLRHRWVFCVVVLCWQLLCESCQFLVFAGAVVVRISQLVRSFRLATVHLFVDLAQTGSRQSPRVCTRYCLLLVRSRHGLSVACLHQRKQFIEAFLCGDNAGLDLKLA